MTDNTEIIHFITKFFNDRNIPFVIGGGFAIKYYCEWLLINNNININNIDIFYLANTPITPEYIHTYKRVQTAPCTSMTYMMDNNISINITMCRSNSIGYINYNNMKLMHPKKLLSYYNEDFSFDETRIYKIKLIEQIMMKTVQFENIYIYQENRKPIFKRKRSESNSITPLTRRLFTA